MQQLKMKGQKNGFHEREQGGRQFSNGKSEALSWPKREAAFSNGEKPMSLDRKQRLIRMSSWTSTPTLSSGAHSFVLLTICSCRHSKRQFLDAQTQGKEAYENNWSPKEKQEKVEN